MQKQAQKPPKSKFSSSQKSKICQFKSENPEKSQKELSIYFSHLFNTKIGRSTIGDILRESQKWFHPSLSHFEEILSIQLSSQHLKNSKISEQFLISTIKHLSSELKIPPETVLTDEFLLKYEKKFNIQRSDPQKPENFSSGLSNIQKNDSDSENFEEFFFFTKTEPIEPDCIKKGRFDKDDENLVKNKYLTHLQALNNSKILTEYFESIGRKQDVLFMNKIDEDIEQSIFCCTFLKMESQNS